MITVAELLWATLIKPFSELSTLHVASVSANTQQDPKTVCPFGSPRITSARHNAPLYGEALSYLSDWINRLYLLSLGLNAPKK